MDETSTAYKSIVIFSSCLIVLIGLDLITDARAGGSLTHLIWEGLLLVSSAFFFVFGLLKIRSAAHSLKRLEANLTQLQAEKEDWQRDSRKLLEGLSIKIENQFSQWKLSPAETEIGFLLIKGFSLKEISEIRQTKTKTTQQQAQSIYQKSGLCNRSELAAFFLEDLLPPQEGVLSSKSANSL